MSADGRPEVARTMSVDASVSAKAEGGPGPVGVPAPDGRSIDTDTSRVYRSDMGEMTDDVLAEEEHLAFLARRRRNRNNKNRGATFERTVAKALGGRRTGPLGGRDDVVGENFAAQTKKTINFSGRQARAYLDDLARIYPTRTALVIHAEPGRDREAIVVLRLQDWIQWHGPDAVGNEGEAA